jgi:hypothetical protein
MAGEHSSCQKRGKKSGLLVGRLMLLVCLWQGPVPVLHHHDFPGGNGQNDGQLWRHVIAYHRLWWEQARRGWQQYGRLVPEHLCWHWHFVLPRQPLGDEDSDDKSAAGVDCPTLGPCAPRVALAISHEMVCSPRMVMNLRTVASDIGEFFVARRRPRDFLISLTETSSLRAWCGVAIC